jgi:hypothetical protein
LPQQLKLDRIVTGQVIGLLGQPLLKLKQLPDAGNFQLSTLAEIKTRRQTDSQSWQDRLRFQTLAFTLVSL